MYRVYNMAAISEFHFVTRKDEADLFDWRNVFTKLLNIK